MEHERLVFTPADEHKQIDTRRRQVRHLISTASIDRAGDIVDVEGWDLENYLSNPVVMIDHSYSVRDLIGGGAPEIAKDGLWTVTTFGKHELGEAAFELVKHGVAKAWSVGFRALKKHRIRDGESVDCPVCMEIENPGYGVHFLGQELMEYSLVAVPMNPDAVLAAQSKGVSPSEFPRLFEVGAGEPARESANPQRESLQRLATAAQFVRGQRETEARREQLKRLRDLLQR